MPGKIRILMDRIDEVVPQHHKELDMRKWWREFAPDNYARKDCLCERCKGFSLKFNRDTLTGIKVVSRDRYMPKGRTYRKKIEKSLEGMEYKMSREGEFFVYRW